MARLLEIESWGTTLDRRCGLKNYVGATARYKLDYNDLDCEALNRRRFTIERVHIFGVLKLFHDGELR